MIKTRISQMLALVLMAVTIEGGCIILPEVKSKIIELVVSGSVCDTLDATGVLNNHDDEDFVDFKAGLNIQQLLADAGIDVSKVDSIAVFGVTYRTTMLDPAPDREIMNGMVTVQRGSGTGPGFVPSTGEIPVIQNFNVMVNSVTTDATAPVTAAGIALINQILRDCLNEAKGLGPALNTVIRYHVTGVSNPQGVAAAFKWRICVAVNIKGEVEVDVVE